MEVGLLTLTVTGYIAMVTANQNTCPAVQYSGSFKADNNVSDHALLGHSYKNVTASSVQECFNICVMNCACVSYQLSGTRCELMDEDRHTVPSEHFQERRGYKYYELKQRVSLPKNVPPACTGHCRNGCCQVVTCLNGGTCIEQCDDVKPKFKCLCIPGYFTGRMCEKPMTCAAHGKRLVSGLYPITLPSGNKTNVYCDFHSQPGFVWTLIETFAFANMLKYKYKPFVIDFAVNQDTFNWTDYRLSRSVMLHIRSNSTLFRATCKYDTDGLIMRDYLRGLLTNMDIMTYASYHICAHVQYINVRGINCTECTTHFYQTYSYHPFVDSGRGFSIGCQWDGRQGSVSYWSNFHNRYVYDDNFGLYLNPVNPAHRCSSSTSSTTQWWLGTPEDGRN